MGFKAGIVLSVFGLLISMLVLAAVQEAVRVLASPPTGDIFSGLGAGIAVFMAAASALLSAIFYGAAYLTTRGLRSAVVGGLMIVGGLLLIISSLILAPQITKWLAGPAEESLTLMGLIIFPLVLGLLTIVGGVRRVRAPKS
ncbi:hypothetical protein HRbin01_01930 [archaeon HR01]|nr:hypothetical protein HRbin01_01930 [archaeon HR01]